MKPASARQRRLALSTTASRTALSSNDVLLMTCRTSAIAVSLAVGSSIISRLELLEAIDVHDENRGAAHLDLHRVGHEEVARFDQRWHRIHELAARPAIFFDQSE